MTFFKQFRAAPGTLLKGDPMKKKPKVEKDEVVSVGEKHLAFIRKLPCLITGKTPVDAAHVSLTSKIWGKGGKGVGKKELDRWTVPLAHRVHMDQHDMGEVKFWKSHGIDPLVVACRLWECSGDIEAGKRVLADARSVMKEPKAG